MRSVITTSIPTNGELCREARAVLRGNWKRAIGAWIVWLILSMLIGQLGQIDPILIGAGWVLSAAVMLTLPRYLLKLSRGEPCMLTEAVKFGFGRISTVFCYNMMVALIIWLGLLLLIIPGILWGLDFAIGFWILSEDEIPGVRAAMRRSRMLMYGHRWQYFRLLLRFFGWSLLCLLTLGIGFLWLVPYMSVALARFYDAVRRDEPAAAPQPAAAGAADADGEIQTAPAVLRGVERHRVSIIVSTVLAGAVFGLLLQWTTPCKGAMTAQHAAEQLPWLRILAGKAQCPNRLGAHRAYLRAADLGAPDPDAPPVRRPVWIELPGNHLCGGFGVVTADGRFHYHSTWDASFPDIMAENYALSPEQLQQLHQIDQAFR